jgi:hypothetical protein
MLSRSNSTIRASAKRSAEVADCVSAVEKKLAQLNKFRQACEQAGLIEDFRKAELSTRAFTAECLTFVRARRASDDSTNAIVSQYGEVTTNLITLANSANSAGITLHGETRAIFESINDLMQKMGLGRD